MLFGVSSASEPQSNLRPSQSREGDGVPHAAFLLMLFLAFCVGRGANGQAAPTATRYNGLSIFGAASFIHP